VVSALLLELPNGLARNIFERFEVFDLILLCSFTAIPFFNLFLEFSYTAFAVLMRRRSAIAFYP